MTYFEVTSQITRLGDMVREIGVYEAKARLSELLDQVDSGQEVVITRRGVPVALITQPRPAGTVDDVLGAMRAMRSRVSAGDAITREALHEGHRW